MARRNVWAEQPASFFDRATLDMDGTLVATTGACKAGMDIAYDGTWGYHPLVVSLAETGEVLRLVNRPGNRPSHEGAAAQVDRAIWLCLRAGFRRIVLRGDTDFSQTEHLDRWHALPVGPLRLRVRRPAQPPGESPRTCRLRRGSRCVARRGTR